MIYARKCAAVLTLGRPVAQAEIHCMKLCSRRRHLTANQMECLHRAFAARYDEDAKETTCQCK